MPKILTVGNEEFEFPLENENGNYGSEVTDWASAVSDALTLVQAPNDIPISTASILNNALTPTPVPGFSFDTSEVISINAEYRVERTTTTPANSIVESGTIQGNFDGTTWNIAIQSVGYSGTDFDITNSGQITYISSNITGSNYTGTVYFRAKVFNAAE